MATTHSAEVSGAEQLLKSCMRQVRENIRYTGKYETAGGRRLMLVRKVQFIGVFIEQYPGDGMLEGVALNTGRGRGRYGPYTARAGSVGRDSRLGLGHDAFYIRCDTIGALQRLVDWYKKQ